MSSSFRHTLIILGGGILLFVDRFFKWQAFHGWDEPHLINRFLGWYPFLNRGIAFSIPLPMLVTVPLTLAIVGCLLVVIIRILSGRRALPVQFTHVPLPPPPVTLAVVVLIGFGALSNLFDRITELATIDYWLILTGVINLADIMIATGFVLYLWTQVRHPSSRAV